MHILSSVSSHAEITIVKVVLCLFFVRMYWYLLIQNACAWARTMSSMRCMDELVAQGLIDEVQVLETSRIGDPSQFGPDMMVYPEGVHYASLSCG